MTEPVIELLEDNHYMFWCPGCEMHHSVTVNGYKNNKNAGWGWNGDTVNPTFTPSILVTWSWKEDKKRCHSFIRDGVWEFLSDCTHKLAGQKVPMRPIDAEA